MIKRRDPILSWTVGVSLLAHAIAFCLFFALSADSGANSGEAQTVYQVQLVEGGFGSDLFDGGGSSGGGRKSPEKIDKVKILKGNETAQASPVSVKTPAPQPEPPKKSEPVIATNIQAPVHTTEASPNNAPPSNDGAQVSESQNSNANGSGNGSGSGTGLGAGSGSGSGNGDGNGIGNGRGNGNGNGNGSGDGEGAPSWEPSYRRSVYSRISRAKVYPYSARAARMEGRVVARFTVDSSGTLVSVSIVKPSPYSVLNADAASWVRRAAPFPPFPPEADRPSMTLTYTLVYDLKD